MSAAPWAGDPAVDAALAEMEAWCGYTEISASKELWNEWTAALNKFGAAVYAHALKSKREAVPVASEDIVRRLHHLAQTRRNVLLRLQDGLSVSQAADLMDEYDAAVNAVVQSPLPVTSEPQADWRYPSAHYRWRHKHTSEWTYGHAVSQMDFGPDRENYFIEEFQPAPSEQEK